MREQKKQIKEISFKDKLWKAADKIGNNMDAADYKHIVLGEVFEEKMKCLTGKLSE